MNAKLIGEGALVAATLFGLGMAFSSGFSNAGDSAMPARETSSMTAASAPLPDASTGATNAVAYSAAGEGVFLANGDLVGGK